jgi:hypothetical protein
MISFWASRRNEAATTITRASSGSFSASRPPAAPIAAAARRMPALVGDAIPRPSAITQATVPTTRSVRHDAGRRPVNRLISP